MNIISRRSAIAGSTTLIATAVIWTAPAEAFTWRGLGKTFKKVATTVVQGAHLAGNVLETAVRDGVQILSPIVHELEDDVVKAATLVSTMTQDVPSIVNKIEGFLGQGIVQALPMFLNSGIVAQPLDIYATQSSTRIPLQSSDEQYARAKPTEFVGQNVDFLARHATQNSFTVSPASFTATGGTHGVGSIPGAAPDGKGLYSSIINIADVAKLVSMFLV